MDLVSYEAFDESVKTELKVEPIENSASNLEQKWKIPEGKKYVSQNPWEVSSIDAFLYYNCPECIEKHASKEQFVGHAMVAHAKARITLPAILNEKESSKDDENDHIIETTKSEEKGEIEEFLKIEEVQLESHDEIKHDFPDKLDENSDDPEELDEMSDPLATNMNFDMDIGDKSESEDPKFAEKLWKRPWQVKYERNPETGRYHCKKCDKDFKNSNNLYAHNKVVHEGKALKCDLCPRTFSCRGNLQRHMESIKGHGTKHECNKCEKVFPSSDRLERHQKDYHPQQQVKCDECDKNFASKWSLKQHKKNMHEDNIWMCDLCSVTVKSRHALYRHMLKDHTENVKCKQCHHKPFSSKAALEDHVRSVHQGNFFKCTECPKSYGSKYALSRHIRIAHRKQNSNSMNDFEEVS